MHAGTLLDANDFEVVVPTNFVDLGVPKPKKATGISASALIPMHSVQHLECLLLAPPSCSIHGCIVSPRLQWRDVSVLAIQDGFGPVGV